MCAGFPNYNPLKARDEEEANERRSDDPNDLDFDYESVDVETEEGAEKLVRHAIVVNTRDPLLNHQGLLNLVAAAEHGKLTWQEALVMMGRAVSIAMSQDRKRSHRSGKEAELHRLAQDAAVKIDAAARAGDREAAARAVFEFTEGGNRLTNGKLMGLDQLRKAVEAGKLSWEDALEIVKETVEAAKAVKADKIMIGLIGLEDDQEDDVIDPRQYRFAV